MQIKWLQFFDEPHDNSHKVAFSRRSTISTTKTAAAGFQGVLLHLVKLIHNVLVLVPLGGCSELFVTLWLVQPIFSSFRVQEGVALWRVEQYSC